ncbi:MAG: outer membrane beta-barrel protein [bacterium]|nr:outer membrane beta-barrel protein [bacterium]
MKKVKLINVVLVWIILFSTCPLMASYGDGQYPEESGFSIGVVGGVGIGMPGLSGFEGITVSPESEIGLLGGLMFKIGLLEYLDLEIDALYNSRRGTAKKKYTLPGVAYDQYNNIYAAYFDFNEYELYKFNYIDLPVLIKLKSPGRISPFLGAGGSIGFLMNAESEFSGDCTMRVPSVNYTETGALATQTVDRKNASEKISYSLLASGGVEIKYRESFILGIEGRYSYMLNQINKKESSTENLSIKLHQIQILLTFSYLLGGKSMESSGWKGSWQ